MKIGYGLTRTVLVLPWFVVKFPILRIGQEEFLRGCHENLKESRLSNLAYGKDWSDKEKITKVYFCFFLGLFQIMERVTTLDETGHDLFNSSAEEWAEENFICADVTENGDNIGIRNGNFVLYDYGNFNFVFQPNRPPSSEEES